MADILHRAKEGWYCPKIEEKCAECGKAFKRTDAHIYARSIGNVDKYYCSYTCYRVYERQKEAARPKVWEEEEEELSDTEKAERRVKECLEKIEEYTKKHKRARGSIEKERATRGKSRWKKLLEEAEAALEALKGGHA